MVRSYWLLGEYLLLPHNYGTNQPLFLSCCAATLTSNSVIRVTQYTVYAHVRYILTIYGRHDVSMHHALGRYDA